MLSSKVKDLYSNNILNINIILEEFHLNNNKKTKLNQSFLKNSNTNFFKNQNMIIIIDLKTQKLLL